MAVLAEAISVIVRREAIRTIYPGGWPAFLADCPSRAVCADQYLARVGFMMSDDVRRYVEELQAAGLRFVEDGRCVDLAVVDQQRGPTAPCDWLRFGRTNLTGAGRVSFCEFTEDRSRGVFAPQDWMFPGSLSDKFGFTPREEMARRLCFLGEDGNLDVYLDLDTGKQVYIGRAYR